MPKNKVVMAKDEKNIEATETGKQTIETRRKKLGWSKGDDSDAMEQASSLKILKDLEIRGFTLQKGIPLSAFEDIVVPQYQKSLIVMPESERVCRQLIAQWKSKKIKTIGFDEFDELINQGVKAKEISYINWQKFYQGKPINKPAFVAYCEAMELKWQTICGYDRDQLLDLALSMLNHRQQSEKFKEFSQQFSPVALYIKDPSVNQIPFRWLLKSLLFSINSDNVTAKTMRVCLSDKRAKSDINDLWKRMRLDFCQNVCKLEPQTIALKVVEQLKDHHIILIFDEVDKMDRDYMKKLLDEFWEPLVQATQQLKTPIFHSLLMYWVDWKPNDNKWLNEFPFAQTLADWNPQIPIKNDDICFVDSFTVDEVKRWIKKDDVKAWLSSDFTKIQATIDQLCLLSNPILPETLLEKIYDACPDLGWENYEYTWRNL